MSFNHSFHTDNAPDTLPKLAITFCSSAFCFLIIWFSSTFHEPFLICPVRYFSSIFLRIAVAGLNPHCGENGLFGREEIEEITPAIEAAKAEGITGVVGPCPPDSVFSQAIGGWYDIVVCMYHDQGHIPLKTVGFVYDREKQEWKAVEGVNVTLGLPIIRASVDHGTDFYHAGKGNGNELSLVNAIKYAVKMTGREA